VNLMDGDVEFVTHEDPQLSVQSLEVIDRGGKRAENPALPVLNTSRQSLN